MAYYLRVANQAQVLGFLAGALTTVAFVPQVLRTWRNKSAGDLSMGMLVTFTTGVALWLLYGIALNSMPMMLSNGITLVLALILVGLKYRHR